MSASWRGMKETDAIPQSQAVPSRPIARERGWPSLTRTDIKEGKWGNCYNKSSMCSFLDFLHSARGAGCMEQLCFCSALTPSLKTSSAAHTTQVGTQGEKELSPWQKPHNSSSLCMLVTCRGDADPKGAQAPEEPQAHPWAGDGDPGSLPHPQNCICNPALWTAITLGFTCTVYSPYLK